MVLCEVLACIGKLIKSDRSQSKIKHGLFSDSGDFVIQNYIHYDKCLEAHCKCGIGNILCLFPVWPFRYPFTRKRLSWGLLQGAVISLPPATKLGQGNIFRSVCQEICSWGGGKGSLPHCMLGYTPPRTIPPWEQTPPQELGDTGTKRAVRMLLECILVV